MFRLTPRCASDLSSCVILREGAHNPNFDERVRNPLRLEANFIRGLYYLYEEITRLSETRLAQIT